MTSKSYTIKNNTFWQFVLYVGTIALSIMLYQTKFYKRIYYEKLVFTLSYNI